MGEKNGSTNDAFVDLHIHSKFSDGNFGVEEIIETAFKARLRALSITDHDCIDAVERAQVLGSSVNIEVIPGVELSTELGGLDIHVLGYHFDISDQRLIRKLNEFKDARYERAKKIVRNLNRMGVDLRFDTVEKIAGEGSIGRPHIADGLLKEELVSSFREAFEKYIGYSCPSYVEKMKCLPEESFRLIRGAGGVPILAHPQVTGCDERIPRFVQQGLMGIEVWHTEHTESSRKFYLEYCQKHQLVYTGGSDCHGSRKGKPSIGTLPIPYECVERIREASKRARVLA